MTLLFVPTIIKYIHFAMMIFYVNSVTFIFPSPDALTPEEALGELIITCYNT